MSGSYWRMMTANAYRPVQPSLNFSTIELNLVTNANGNRNGIHQNSLSEVVTDGVLEPLSQMNSGDHFILIMANAYKKLIKKILSTELTLNDVSKNFFDVYISPYRVADSIILHPEPQLVSPVIASICT